MDIADQEVDHIYETLNNSSLLFKANIREGKKLLLCLPSRDAVLPSRGEIFGIFTFAATKEVNFQFKRVRNTQTYENRP